MDEARQLIARLERIDELKERGAPAGELLAEVRLLLAEGEQWLAAERAAKVGMADPEPPPIAQASEALSRCRAAVGRGRAVAAENPADRPAAGANADTAIGKEVVAGAAV